MKHLIFGLLILGSISSNTSMANGDIEENCSTLSRQLDGVLNSYKQTLRNMNGFFETTAQGWENADLLIRSGRLSDRNYNGNMRENARRSRANQREISDFLYRIDRDVSRLKSDLSSCIRSL